MSLVRQEHLSLPEHLSSSPVFGRVPVSQSLVFRVVSCALLFVFLSVVFSVLLFTTSDFLFGIFKLFVVVEEIRFPLVADI